MTRILFICSSLELGKDGVGDYARKLASALINHGHSSAIIAINDRRITGEPVWEGEQCDDDTVVHVLRLSSTLGWKFRIQAAKKFAVLFDPDWISLQYVPFGFQIKGLPFNLDKKLKRISQNSRWHIMFHELSVNKDDSLKFKLWAFFQIQIIKSLLQNLRPSLITSNTTIYQQRLERMGFSTVLLPLFSNISRVKLPDKQSLCNIIPEYLMNNREDYIIGTIFGNFSKKSWDLRSLLDKFPQGFHEKKVVVASVGRMPSGSSYWEVLKKGYPNIIFLTFGMQEAIFISHWLDAYTDFGILTTLPELAGKSGSFMAFKEHGVPVVCKERDGALQRLWNVTIDNNLFEISQGKNAFVLPLKYQPIPVLEGVVTQFINNLNSAG